MRLGQGLWVGVGGGGLEFWGIWGLYFLFLNILFSFRSNFARTKKLIAEIEEMIDVKYIQNINSDMNHQTGQITSFKTVSHVSSPEFVRSLLKEDIVLITKCSKVF